MGCLRTLLAISVLVGHAYGFVFTGPVLAVQVFYAISGFLISFVLTEAGSYRSVSGFYLNRFLRLFPIYWVVALGSLASLMAAEIVFGNSPPAFEVFRDIDPVGKVALVVSNVTILGQDWIMFTGVRDGVFQFVSDYRDSETAVWRGLLVPPAWTLGVELSFYAVAPFVLFRPRLMIALFLASLGLRVVLILYGPGLSDPWTYRFFPTELALFLAGALSHRYWRRWLDRTGRLTQGNALAVTGLVVLTGCLFPILAVRVVSWVLFLTMVLLALPFLFDFQKRLKWDRRIGDLSYPIYIVHWPILYPVGVFWDRALGVKGYRGLDETLVVLVLTLVAALILNRLVADPVESLRRRVKARQKDRAATGAVAGTGPTGKVVPADR